jgi:hypothetical protein
MIAGFPYLVLTFQSLLIDELFEIVIKVVTVTLVWQFYLSVSEEVNLVGVKKRKPGRFTSQCQ